MSIHRPKPTNKANEILQLITPYLKSGERLDQLNYHRLLREARSIPDHGSAMSAEGYVHAAYGEKTKAIMCMESCWNTKNYHEIVNYLFLCGQMGWLKRRGDVSIRAAKETAVRGFSLKAAMTYHSRGDIKNAELFFNKAIKLSEDAERKNLMVTMGNQMNALKETYNITGATEEQFFLIASAVERVVEEFGVLVNSREITPFMGGDYIVEVETDTAKIVDMNFHIAELISKDVRLDSLDMTPRFEHIRKYKKESEYIA